ncbi:hypothetical protein [Blastococcus jejuensis]|uniref:hypothetical protein n=1 Tax=Blastococcus jejuensis TaxID=351224 RepID=UPI0031D8F302
MSGAMESRAAVFTSQPQAVEVYQAGAWWAGELLGWRHAPDGSCQVWVRVVLGGVEETAWTDLAGLRLPERHLAVAPEPSVAADPVTQKLPRATASRSQRPSVSDATASLPMVRDLSVVQGGAPARPGGRRRAPETGEVPAVGSVAVTRPGGRRRAPETAETPAVRPGGRRRAPETGEMAAVRASLPPAAGRHRAADTGLLPVVTDAGPAARAPQDDTIAGRSRSAWAAVGEAEPELLTRPMRLSDHVPHARRPRLDGSLAGV